MKYHGSDLVNSRRLLQTFFHFDGVDYQVIVNYNSNFGEIDTLHSIKTTAIIKKMKFACFSTIVTVF